MTRRRWLAASVCAALSTLLASSAATCAARADAVQGSQAPQAPLLIDAYGDSTTLGITCHDGHCGPQSQNAVAYLQDALRAHHGDRVQVTNLGVGGTTATQLRDGTGNRRAGPSAGLPWRERLAASPARIVLINYGINEVMQNQTPEQFYTAETTLVKTARALGRQPVLQTSNPMPDNRLNARLAAMAAMTRRVAEEQQVPLVDQFAYISGLPDWKTLMSDGAHPKPQLYRLKAEQDYQVVEPLVRRKLDSMP
ncbi:Lysophospholipase L1-like esterase [Paraburkholderia ribeironis]|uniref:Lysophospholipase L1-like esterase n=1 Tax=Paraburkholderia ribeironis TaxID=1247936 RepID=A0A1N7RWA1_9BURK|nr:SGNH/GDSL hydrolase family protein [Paraburkholderia ribeironis]SIT39380.1 Lysophospholipase L1-like esterase [Paraburkholderia ribeironis]